MRKNKLFIIMLLALALLAVACVTEKQATADKTGKEPAPIAASPESHPPKSPGRNENVKPIDPAARVNKSTYQIVTETYVLKDMRHDVTISYPQITNLGDSDRQARINELIKKEAVLLSLPGRPTSDERLLTVRFDYKITWQSANLLSFQYHGHSYAKGAPYSPNHLVATNINIAKGSKVILKDLVVIDKNFAEKLRSENIKTVSPLPGKLSGKQIFIEYTPLNTAEDTIEKLNKADIVVSEVWLPGTYCYFTPEAFGISTGVSHVIGDHAEFEIKYEDMVNYIRAENDVWKDFFTGVGSKQ